MHNFRFMNLEKSMMAELFDLGNPLNIRSLPSMQIS